ncbi:hypothetical protein LOTGIDRAFT_158742 [Lottia gigantea]|uniref:Mannosyltransferase n=1 Tax=Lottia gigantea TaxID=225164 RepID=V4AUZ3_LOTGI|nr:hypothetical protein LOTGIDRAFT_158742 [Lottia gigantea]ESO98795.1 hypothetical protein LOTGIDRAFT_158742 [Lottia gigantea]
MRISVVILMILRFLMVLLPQIGYIHPDEFFQSTEIVAGDQLGIDVFRAWEFNPENPIRCIAFPYIISGLPLSLLKWLQHFSWMVISPYWLLVLPRLWMAVLSLITDYCIYIMCQTFDINSDSALKLFSISYIALVFLCRTFSNSLETFFVSLFICVLLKGSAKWKMKSAKKKLYFELNPLSSISSYFLGSIAISGMFNRPTFIFFIIAPVVLWVLIFFKKSPISYKISALMTMAGSATIGALTAFLVLVYIDQLYYKEWSIVQLHDHFLECLAQSSALTCIKNFFSSLVITPWNFISYNSQSDHLAEHGLHPRILHLFVNVPMLLGPVAVLIIIGLLRTISKMMTDVFDVNLKMIYLFIAFICPISYLSLFPHQEPRFLLPIIPFACVMAADILESSKFQNVFWCLWIVFNICATVFFGFLHQGGVVATLLELQSEPISNVQNQINRQLIFYKTYMPPKHLMTSQNFSITDLAGEHSQTLIKTLTTLQKQSENSYAISIITPNTVFQKIKDILPQNFKLEFVCPHFSGEDPPNILNTVKNWYQLDEHLSLFCMNILTFS